MLKKLEKYILSSNFNPKMHLYLLILFLKNSPELQNAVHYLFGHPRRLSI